MFDYTVETTNGIDATIEKLQKNLEEEKFGILWDFDVKSKLQEKGLDHEQPFRILEVCNPHEAKMMLDMNQMVGYFLPCKIVVYSDQDKTKIGMPKPSSLIKLVNDDRLHKTALEIENRLISAIDKSV
ncbi:DUF302 domain-containing protein [Salipaludibacillus sp. CF4.18]|uniref:DUF302 domain-containing protein n=1 Tax=Salipaludibacillus sp. CF4.18 TaxID=3373081 RepID=UPI003EE6C5BF